jgi:hypothetical protein
MALNASQKKTENQWVVVFFTQQLAPVKHNQGHRI